MLLLHVIFVGFAAHSLLELSQTTTSHISRYREASGELASSS